jgi:hypothetical protein
MESELEKIRSKYHLASAAVNTHHESRAPLMMSYNQTTLPFINNIEQQEHPALAPLSNQSIVSFGGDE